MEKTKKYLFPIILILIIGIVALMMLKKVTTYDYWWHVKAGEYIIKNKTVPSIDIFSWYGIENSLKWITHEWLFEVIIYFNSILLPLNGGYIFCGLSTLSTFILLLIFNKKNYTKNLVFTLLWLILGGLIFSQTFNPRPHLISNLLLILEFYILLDLKNNENSKKIFILPLIGVIWVNVHGGSSNLIYIIPIIFIMGGLFNINIYNIKSTKFTKKQLIKYISLTILSIMCLAINPSGLDMITYPFEIIGDKQMMFTISEWRSPDLKVLADFSIYGEMLVLAVIFVASKKEKDITDLAIIGSFIYLTAQSIRFAPLLYIASTFIIFKYVEELNNINFEKKIGKIICIFSLFYIIFFVFSPQEYNLTENVPTEIVETLKKENPKRIFNDYNFGGYLIYNDINVFIDGRADMYAKNIFKDSYDLRYLYNDPNEIIKKYNFDYLVISTSSPIGFYLKHSDEFEKIKEVDGTAIYKNLNWEEF